MIAPLDFITRLREIYPERYADFSEGCLKFYLLLKAMYPQANGWFNSTHTLTEIDGHCYDIDGLAIKTPDYLPIEEFGCYHTTAWSTSRRLEVMN